MDADAELSPFNLNGVMDALSVTLTLLYVFSLAIQLDVSPTWSGWNGIECAFLGLFSIEIILRYLWHAHGLHWSRRHVVKFFAQPIIIFDVSVIVIGWIELLTVLTHVEAEGPVQDLNWTRLLRFARCARLVRLLWYCHELRVFVEGILTSMKSAVWGVALIFLIILSWAIVIRTGVQNRWAPDQDAVATAFPNLPESVLKVFRCMAISADSACIEKPSEFGWFFNLAWAMSEAFILIGIVNVVASIYVVQALENDQKIKQNINNSSLRADVLRLQKLDKLLRTLIHPGREKNNPKDRNAAEVASIIREEYPDVADRLPNLELQIVDFAQHIQDAKQVHQNAMDIYEAQEYTECKELRNIPSAKTFLNHHDEEALMISSEDACTANTLMLPLAASGALQVLILQDQEDLGQLLDEADEVQHFVKSVIYPDSAWAFESGSGASGEIWKASKGICDEAIDPGLKSRERIVQKVTGKYQGKYERCRDYARLALIYNSVRHLIQAIPRFLEFRLDVDGFQIVSLENRFVEPHPLGWRDVTLLLKVRVPSSMAVGEITSHHIMELQLRLRHLADICHLGHRFYEEIRAHLPADLVHLILDLLVTDTTLDLGITKAEWLQCLPNKEVKKIMDALGIPRHIRKDLFDVIDIDGSGTVTSSELKEMLLLVKDPVNAHEMAGCHFRVRDIQRQLQSRLEPQLSMINDITVKAVEENERRFDDLSKKIKEAMDRGEDKELSRIISTEVIKARRSRNQHDLGYSHGSGTQSASVRSLQIGRRARTNRDPRLRRSNSSPVIPDEIGSCNVSRSVTNGSGSVRTLQQSRKLFGVESNTLPAHRMIAEHGVARETPPMAPVTEGSPTSRGNRRRGLTTRLPDSTTPREKLLPTVKSGILMTPRTPQTEDHATNGFFFEPSDMV
jgi:hypothetical protein